MDKDIKTISEDTSPFVEALEAVIKSENRVLQIFLDYYGDGQGGGEFVFEDTGISSHFQGIRDTLKDFISHQIESEIYYQINKVPQEGEEEKV